MDYLITMETGDKFLMHHGVKGQKWGRWNSETAARYAGGTDRKSRNYIKGYEKHKKLKAVSERMADNYVANPSHVNAFKFNRAVTREANQNSPEMYEYQKKNLLYGNLHTVTKESRGQMAKISAEVIDTRAKRLEDAINRAKKSGFKPSSDVQNLASSLRRQSELRFKEHSEKYGN